MTNKPRSDVLIQITTAQRLFIRYLIATLIDLVVLNLFAEHWKLVFVSSFTISIFAAILLQVLLKATLALEERVAAYFRSKPGRTATLQRLLGAFLILFGSKFVILAAIDLVFGASVEFSGPVRGVVAFVVVVITMVIAERVTARLFWKLAGVG